MTIKSFWKRCMNDLEVKYDFIKKAGNIIADDFRELFQYTSKYLDKIIYQSNGLVGLYNDIAYSGKTSYYKLHKIRNDFSEIENILFSRKNTADSSVSSRYDYDTLNKIIDIKNKYFRKHDTELNDLKTEEIGIKVTNIESIINNAMTLKVNNPSYSALNRINYDSRIASQKMKDEFITAYSSYEKTLKELSVDLEKKYGMYISSSTISRHARKHLSSKGLEFKNRREAKKYHKNIST